MHANEQSLLELQKHDNVNVLFIYTTLNNEETETVRQIDMLLHHFTDHVDILPDTVIDEADDVTNYSHIVYYGDVERTINERVIDLFEAFEGNIFAIGNNTKQIPRYRFMKEEQTVPIQATSFNGDNEDATSLQYNLEVKKIKAEDYSVHLYGHSYDEKIPLLVEHERSYYLAATTLEETIYYCIAEILHHFFNIEHKEHHLGYVLIDHIHPKTDEEMLYQVGKKLSSRNIPFMLAISTVFIDNDRGKTVHLAKNKALLNVLQQLQRDGAVVIAKGYVHFYSDDPANSTYEFWDREFDQFYTGELETEPFLTLSEFTNKEAYEQYIAPYHEKEAEYIRTTVEKALKELTYNGLFPLAFTVPEYRISKNGYETVADHFSTLIGKVQWSDHTATNVGSPPFMTKASFLNETTLIPEPLSLYTDKSAFFKHEIERALLVRDSVLNVRFPVYVDADVMADALDTIEAYTTNITWLDMLTTKQHVVTNDILVKTTPSGTIEVDRHVKWWDDLFFQRELSTVELVLWGITALVLTFVLLFTLFTLRLRAQRKKRLFKEQK